MLNKNEISRFPFTQTLNNAKNYLSDGLNNWFFVSNGKVEVSKSLQHSLDKITDAPTQNNFALAAINHGTAPKNADYEYMVLIQPKANELKSTVAVSYTHLDVYKRQVVTYGADEKKIEKKQFVNFATPTFGVQMG